MRWSSWQSIEEPIPHAGPAVYMTRIVDSTGSPFPICRFVLNDPEGLFSIGKTKTIEPRRKQFFSGIEKCYGHSSANLLWYLSRHTSLNTQFPGHRYQIRYQAMVATDPSSFEEKWSVDLLRCDSILLKTHWVLAVTDQFTRGIIGFTAHVSDVDGLALCRMFN